MSHQDIIYKISWTQDCDAIQVELRKNCKLKFLKIRRILINKRVHPQSYLIIVLSTTMNLNWKWENIKILIKSSYNKKLVLKIHIKKQQHGFNKQNVTQNPYLTWNPYLYLPILQLLRPSQTFFPHSFFDFPITIFSSFFSSKYVIRNIFYQFKIQINEFTRQH